MDGDIAPLRTLAEKLMASNEEDFERSVLIRKTKRCLVRVDWVNSEVKFVIWQISMRRIGKEMKEQPKNSICLKAHSEKPLEAHSIYTLRFKEDIPARHKSSWTSVTPPVF